MIEIVSEVLDYSRDHHHFTLEHAFSNTKQQNSDCKAVICEDSSAIAAVFSELLDCDVIPAGSRSDFYRHLAAGSNFLIADKPKFGQEKSGCIGI